MALEAQVGLEVLGDLADESLEWQLTDQELGALLKLADFAESDRAGLEALLGLDTSCARSGLAGGLRCKGLTRGLPAC